MKKRILLLPLALFSYLLSACDHAKENVTLQEMLEINDGYTSHMYIVENSIKKDYEFFNGNDYDLSLYKIFQENLVDFKLVGKVDKLRDDDIGSNYICYSFTNEKAYKEMNNFHIYLCEDGCIFTGYSEWLHRAPITRFAVYMTDIEIAHKIFEKTCAFVKEVEEDGQTKRKEAEEQASIPGFFAQTTNIVNNGLHYQRNDFSCTLEISDSLLNELADLNYEKIDGYNGAFPKQPSSSIVLCRVSKDWFLVIDVHQSIAQMTYVYEIRYRSLFLQKYYSVDSEKISNIVDELENVVKEQNIEINQNTDNHH